jgi:KTSC domain-containing protein
MVMIPVSSSAIRAIRAIGYDGSTLIVEFHNSRVYDHPGVPYEVYAGLMAVASKGSCYNRYIRGRYR